LADWRKKNFAHSAAAVRQAALAAACLSLLRGEAVISARQTTNARACSTALYTLNGTDDSDDGDRCSWVD